MGRYQEKTDNSVVTHKDHSTSSSLMLTNYGIFDILKSYIFGLDIFGEWCGEGVFRTRFEFGRQGKEFKMRHSNHGVRKFRTS